MIRPDTILGSLCAALLVTAFLALTPTVRGEDEISVTDETLVVGDGNAVTNADGSALKNIRDELLKERLQDRVLKSFRSGADSLEGLVPEYMPQQRTFSPAEIRRLKERIMEQRAWMYGDDASALRDTKVEDPFDVSSPEYSGLGEDTLSILKRQYRNLDDKRLSLTNAAGGDRPLSGDSGDDPNLLGRELTDGAKNRKNSLGQENGLHENLASKSVFDSRIMGLSGMALPNNIFADVLGEPSVAALPAASGGVDEQRISDFRKFLDSGPSAGTMRANTLNSMGNSLGSAGAALAAGTFAETRSMPTMATMPGYEAASSLAPAFSGSPAIAAPLAIPEPELVRPVQFNQSFGPPRRLF